MENGITQEGLVQETRPEVDTRTSATKRSKLIVITIFIIVLLSSVVFIFISLNQSSQRTTTVASQPTPQTKDKFVTKETKIASSLDIPLLPSGAKWTDTTGQSKNSDINHAYIDDTESVSFQGKYWSTEVPKYPSNEIISYVKGLQKNGWIVDASVLQFNTFSLRALVADGPCGGVEGFIGFKDGMVRIVSILHEMSPCVGDDEEPSPTRTKSFVKYTIFISEPMALNAITKLIKNHSSGD